ncbi:hypothetical protein [Gillisia limnaea]|uniref:DUF3575 domain-containing protein n=1 Tax=Gillisia limnaea (strain DSM 15749 / LMG 21470 / R-8282) TaxID=865937 RepID=H2BZA0_GILLR|nr:hypothetical protein [Gillisia limnaea]EHQ01229.1 hypothetical protein Gilli_0517 [Gillisia limnaea DSM 15749]
MQKIITSFFLITSLAVFSQEREVQIAAEIEPETIYHRDISKNEVSIGALNLVAFGALDIAYERIITPNTSWAVEAFVLALNRDSEDIAEAYRKDFSLTGKFKYFFSDRTAWGFYVNGLTMISTGENEETFFNSDGSFQTETENYTDLAVGFGLGGKFVAKQGFLLDLNAGIGRNLFNSQSPTIIGQFGVNLGYRF